MALPLTCFTALLLAQAAPERPSDVAWQAVRSIERDSATHYRSAWEAALARNPADRRAMLGLASLDRLLYNPDAALDRYRQLLDRPPPNDPYTPYAWIGLGWLNIWKVSFDSSRTILRHALDAGMANRDSVAQVEAGTILGFLESRLTGPQAGVAMIEHAMTLLPRDQRPLEGAVRCTIAPILSFAGRPDAEAQGRRGLALALESGDRRMQGLCYQSLANVLIATSSDVAHAEILLDSAVPGHQAAKDHDMMAITLFTKGYNRLGTFDLAAAKRDLLEALVEARAAGSDFAEAWSHRMLSRLHWQTGNIPAAEQEYRQAGVLFEKLNDGLALGGMQTALGIAAIVQGRLDEAEAIFRRRLAVTQRIGQAEGEIDLRGLLASIEAARGNWSAARQGYQETGRFAAQRGHSGWVPYYQYTAAFAALRMGQLDLAERELRGLVALGLSEPSARYAVRSRLAEVLVRRGDIEGALREIDGATDQLDSVRTHLDDHQLKLLVFQTRDDRDEPDLGLATIAAGLVQGGRVAEAFQLSERRRARSLSDNLLQAQVLREDSAGNRPAPPIEPGSSDLASMVPDDRTAVIEFLAGRRGQPSVAFVLTRSGIRGAVLPSMDSVAPAVVSYLQEIQRGNTVRSSGEELRRRMLDPVLEGLPPEIDRLLIVPDDLLHRVPLDALPLADGKPLLTRFAVAIVPSAAIAAHLATRRRVQESPRVLAVGDPRFSDEKSISDPTSEIYRSAFLETGGLPRLAASAKEARLAARFSSRSELRLRDDASESWLKRSNLAGFNIIHVASHALVDERTLERTAIALAPGNGEDGFLSAGDLSALKLDADLVVLSACRTAGGVVVGGEGVQGLVAPLISAGAKSVVATMWPVGDRSTARFVEDFYRQLADGKDVAEAMRQAKLAAIERGAPLAEWAAFNVIGDPLVQIRLQHPSPRWLTPILVVAVVTAIGTALLYGLWRRRVNPQLAGRGFQG
jgi:CHAT domain-containing protein/tetratricopeptide (TPR) repeat protein